MKVLFNGLGPKDTVTYKGKEDKEAKIYRNGSVVEMPEESASAYISARMAVEVATEADKKEAAALQKLETNNEARRKNIREKAENQKEGE